MEYTVDKDVDLDAQIQNSNYTIHNNMIDTVADIPMLYDHIPHAVSKIIIKINELFLKKYALHNPIVH